MVLHLEYSLGQLGVQLSLKPPLSTILDGVISDEIQ
jgi:hypothetical protein